MHRNRILYCLYLIFLLYISMIYNNYGLYVVFAMSVFLTVVAAVLCLLIRPLRISWGTPLLSGGEKEGAGFGIVLRNDSIIPTGDVVIRYSVTDVQKNSSVQRKLKTAVSAGSATEEQLDAEFFHPGNVILRLKSVRVSEPLGLFSRNMKIEQSEIAFSVMPEMYDLLESPFRNNPYAYVEEEEYSKVKPGDDPSELFGTREYRPGDRRNRIHWALTAKQDELIVKELGLPVECSSLVLLDMIRTDEDMEIKALFETVFTLSRHLAAKGHRHRLAWYDSNRGVLSRVYVEHAEEVYDAIPQVFCCRLSRESETGVKRYFADYPRERFKNIFYVTNSLDDNGLDALRELRGDAYVECYLICPVVETADEGEWRVTTIRPKHVEEDLAGKGGAQ